MLCSSQNAVAELERVLEKRYTKPSTVGGNISALLEENALAEYISTHNTIRTAYFANNSLPTIETQEIGCG